MNQQQKQFKVLVLGDACWDISSYGQWVANIEDPSIQTIKIKDEFHRSRGMSYNVFSSLKSLGLDVSIAARPEDKWSVKHRIYTSIIFASTSKYLVRIDNDKQCKPIENDMVPAYLYDAIVVCDYLKGAVTKELLQFLDTECAKLEIPLFVDTKKTDLSYLKHAIIKVNKLEASRIESWPTEAKLVITLGAEGCTYAGTKYPSFHANVVEDVCGAGDAFMSGLVYGYLETKDLNKACEYANATASLSVETVGYNSAGRDQVIKRMNTIPHKGSFKYA